MLLRNNYYGIKMTIVAGCKATCASMWWHCFFFFFFMKCTNHGNLPGAKISLKFNLKNLEIFFPRYSLIFRIIHCFSKIARFGFYFDSEKRGLSLIISEMIFFDIILYFSLILEFL